MDIRREELEKLIDDYILSELHRGIVKRKLLDNIPYEPLAEEFDMSVRQCKRIVYRSKEVLFRNIPTPSNLIA